MWGQGLCGLDLDVRYGYDSSPVAPKSGSAAGNNTKPVSQQGFVDFAEPKCLHFRSVSSEFSGVCSLLAEGLVSEEKRIVGTWRKAKPQCNKIACACGDSDWQ
jgi:hypothetical protein